MNSRRWQDVVIGVAMVALLATGVWALWWDDLRGWLGGHRGVNAAPPPAAAPAGSLT